MGYLGGSHYEKLEAISKSEKELNDSCEMANEEEIETSLSVFKSGYVFHCHPDCIMHEVYISKLTLVESGLWTAELQKRYDALEKEYKQYALRGIPPYENEL